ncbi:hypothetical protein [Candidatus Electronema sp. PJ]|uniref:hypothetical protein n=1 Tax=Candidatus Electronema sp. PJ TaxID=3401572 RepID=UPI003AA8793E
MNITLTPEIERVLSDLAEKEGTDVESVALRTLRECFLLKKRKPVKSVSEKKAEPRNLADLLGGYIGRIDSGELAEGSSGQLSTRTGEKLTKILLEQRRQGKL